MLFDVNKLKTELSKYFNILQRLKKLKLKINFKINFFF